MSPDWSAKEEPVPYAKLDNPQSLNLYGYVGNNPLSKADPDGHEECCVLPSMEEVDAVVKPLVASAAGVVVTGTEFAVSTALAPVVAIGGLLASPTPAGNYNDDHPNAQTKNGLAPSESNPVIEPQTSSSGAGARQGGGTIYRVPGSGTQSGNPTLADTTNPIHLRPGNQKMGEIDHRLRS